MDKICPCGKVFSKPRTCSRKDWEQRKTCSPLCGNKFKKTPWLVAHQIKPGQHLSPATELKPGVGADNIKWKGDQASYAAIHMWAAYNFGRPKFCEQCGLNNPNRVYHWANLTGQYLRDREDWMRMCVPCHKRFDLGL